MIYHRWRGGVRLHNQTWVVVVVICGGQCQFISRLSYTDPDLSPPYSINLTAPRCGRRRSTCWMEATKCPGAAVLIFGQTTRSVQDYKCTLECHTEAIKRALHKAAEVLGPAVLVGWWLRSFRDPPAPTFSQPPQSQ